MLPRSSMEVVEAAPSPTKDWPWMDDRVGEVDLLSRQTGGSEGEGGDEDRVSNRRVEQMGVMGSQASGIQREE